MRESFEVGVNVYCSTLAGKNHLTNPYNHNTKQDTGCFSPNSNCSCVLISSPLKGMVSYVRYQMVIT